jgi:hypothetical protein
VERAPAVVRGELELLGRGLERLLDGALELLPQACEQRVLLLALGREALRVRGDPGLDLGERLPVPLLEAADLVGDRLLSTLEVRRPAGELLLDLLLEGEQALGELADGLPLSLGELAPPLLGEPALLLREERARACAGAPRRAPSPPARRTRGGGAPRPRPGPAAPVCAGISPAHRRTVRTL